MVEPHHVTAAMVEIVGDPPGSIRVGEGGVKGQVDAKKTRGCPVLKDKPPLPDTCKSMGSGRRIVKESKIGGGYGHAAAPPLW